jgi:hypothetical protein
LALVGEGEGEEQGMAAGLEVAAEDGADLFGLSGPDLGSTVQAQRGGPAGLDPGEDPPVFSVEVSDAGSDPVSEGPAAGPDAVFLGPLTRGGVQTRTEQGPVEPSEAFPVPDPFQAAGFSLLALVVFGVGGVEQGHGRSSERRRRVVVVIGVAQLGQWRSRAAVVTFQAVVWPLAW